jgi:putative endonuclease
VDEGYKRHKKRLRIVVLKVRVTDLTAIHKRQKGNIGEAVACEFLIRSGFTVLKRNYLKKWGEIDIVGIKDNVLHFFEVKSVTRPFGTTDGHRPEDNVHALKTRHIGRMIQTFMFEYRYQPNSVFQFHVLCVYMNEQTRRAKVKMIENVII